MKKRKILVAITAASGSIYAQLLLDQLSRRTEDIVSCSVVFSDQAKAVWQHEMNTEVSIPTPFNEFNNHDFTVPCASGSSAFDTMIICPCSMGTIGRLAAGVSDTLITRAADVMLKERNTLVIVARETPLNLIHLRNMNTLAEAGAIICPACPSFYSKPQTVEDIALTVVARVMKLIDLPSPIKPWNGYED